MKKISLVVVACLLIAVGCKKDDPENPYETLESVQVDNPSVDEIPIGNFAWLHGKVFKPTCANSGCHDGTFEPDFRTISSSYNSLVNHPVISNNAAMSFTKRVDPGSASASLLNERLTADIPNSSGMMPLEVDEESDWEELSDSYIAQIQAWINAGAPDMFGNLPTEGSSDLPPIVIGLVTFPSGNTITPYTRDPDGAGIPPIQVEAGLIDIWVSVYDEVTPMQDIEVNELRYATSLDGLELAAVTPFVTTDFLTAQDFSGSDVPYFRKATIDLSSANSGQVFFLRTSFSDGVNNTVDTPNEGSNPFLTAIFALEVL